jgi:hypothetical protein
MLRFKRSVHQQVDIHFKINIDGFLVVINTYNQQSNQVNHLEPNYLISNFFIFFSSVPRNTH